jgi:uncharacterized membrane protein
MVVAIDRDDLPYAEPARHKPVAAKFLTPDIEQLIGRTGAVSLQTHTFTGPMPLPEHLAQYDRIVPGAARLIVDEFQSNSRHARDMERIGLSGSIRRDTRAQSIAGFLVLIGFGLVYGLAEHGHDGVAISVAVTLLVAVLTAFLTGTVMRMKGEDEIEASEAPDN